MINDLKTICAGLGYEPRDVQIKAVEFLESHLDKGERCKVLSIPVAGGKSIIARAVARFNARKGLGTAIITPQNILIDQYARDFPELNCFKGKLHYDCHVTGTDCQDGMEMERVTGKSCTGCPYRAAKQRALDDNITIFNPVSFYMLKNAANPVYSASTIIVDEFQSLPVMLRELVTIKLWSHDIRWKPGVTSSIPGIVEILNIYLKNLDFFIKKESIDKKTKVEFMSVRKKTGFIVSQLVHEPSGFVCEETEQLYRGLLTKCLLIRPKYVTESISRNFFSNAKNIILMSGTAFSHIWGELGFGKVDYMDLPSPIPKQRRLVFVTNSVSLSASHTEEVKREEIYRLVDCIKHIVKGIHANENGVILLPYNLANTLRDLLDDPCFLHMSGKKTKKGQIEKFRSGEGYYVGVFSGSYEGLSLDNNKSRFTIIPKTVFPNLMDKIVRARMESDPLNYQLETMTTMIQASGRSTRSEADFSFTYILDRNFFSSYAKVRQHVPAYFRESLVFSMPQPKHLELLNEFRKIQE